MLSLSSVFSLCRIKTKLGLLHFITLMFFELDIKFLILYIWLMQYIEDGRLVFEVSLVEVISSFLLQPFLLNFIISESETS